jgi:predicted permease
LKRIPLWRRYDRLGGPDIAGDVRQELRFHMESLIEDLLAQGWEIHKAREEASRRFGNVRALQKVGSQIGDRMERRHALHEYWTHFLQDLRYSLRSFQNNPGFFAVSICVLAVGLGANVAVFSVVNTLMLRPLPFPDSNQLVWFTGGKSLDAKTQAAAGLSGRTYTVDAFEEFQRHNRSFASVTTYQTFYSSLQYKLTASGEPRQLSVVEVAENFLPTLQVEPVLGRVFTHDECLKGGRPAAILSHDFWKTHFASDKAIIGKIVTINGTATTVVGVLPSTFEFGATFAPGMKVDLFVPAAMDFWRTWGNTLAIVGRLKQGVSLTQAQQEADQLFPELKIQHPDWYEDYASALTPLKDHVAGKLHRPLVVLWSAVALIMLIVCANLANLQLARASSRNKEFAMRSALGAGRARLIRQLLTESLVVTTIGAALGLGIAWVILFYLTHQNLVTLPLLDNINLDLAAVQWMIITSMAAGCLFGLAPALRIATPHLMTLLKDSGMSVGRRHDRSQAALVICEVSLACILLVGAGLLLRSFLRVLDVDLGFQPTHAAAMQIDINDNGKLAQRGPLLQETLRHVSALPGIESAGIADMLPLDRNRSWSLQAADKPHRKDADSSAFVYLVTPGYFAATGMQLRGGRDFSWQDTPDHQHVVLINDAMARREWPGENPVGKLASGIEKTPVRVIGVLADVHESSPEEASNPEVYIPMTQNPDIEGTTLVIRSRIDPRTMGPALLSTLRDLNPAQPANELRPLQSLVDHAESARRFFVLLVGIFAVLGSVLAGFGIYGVTSYVTGRKTREIGVRMALGATTARVQLEIVTRTLYLALAGIALGTLGSIAVARLIASLLFATSPWDALTFVTMIAVILALATVSGLIPARRASRLDPLTALRTE